MRGFGTVELWSIDMMELNRGQISTTYKGTNLTGKLNLSPLIRYIQRPRFIRSPHSTPPRPCPPNWKLRYQLEYC
jgi:hypothetical protein